MTLARVGSFYVESTTSTTTKARTGSFYVDVVAMPTTKARVGAFYIEVVVAPFSTPQRALRAYPRDDILGRVPTPRHPKFSRSQQYGMRRGPSAYK